MAIPPASTVAGAQNSRCASAGMPLPVGR
jgi:hypothetical protein